MKQNIEKIEHIIKEYQISQENKAAEDAQNKLKENEFRIKFAECVEKIIRPALENLEQKLLTENCDPIIWGNNDFVSIDFSIPGMKTDKCKGAFVKFTYMPMGRIIVETSTMINGRSGSRGQRDTASIRNFSYENVQDVFLQTFEEAMNNI